MRATLACMILVCSAALGLAAGPASGQADPFKAKPAARSSDEIAIEKWAKDGGGYGKAKAATGKRFVIVTFLGVAPGTAIAYVAKDFDLAVDNQTIRPYGVTVWSNIKGQEAFKPEVAMSNMLLSESKPISVAFEVPAAAKGGKLKVKDVTHALRW